ncbi:ABC transporter substrate-binding protein [Neorhizobium alkalisoli]|uniref:Peptide/nickel transport system substrate-binding protein n=1 Tax=Neorhizobium alkalisoli TaxID=528178 RepID=A0A561QGG7_9HYPH|nr:ABC transporter substrate-binding protein [Neorhizobium alkalisoli]TWF49391.1 peptide/nickel transport system substrate-binding protein [Neorhizobium alkalisoli]
MKFHARPSSTSHLAMLRTAFAASVALVALSASAEAASLTIGLSSSVNSLDPAQAQVVQTDLSTISELYSSLVTRGPDMKLKGDLAESWAAVDDNTWSFKLKPGIKFPNGEALDAAAVKWNFDRVKSPDTKARNKLWFDPIKSIEVVSPTEIRFITDKPYPALPAQLSMFYLLAPKWTETHNPILEAMGTGPYDLVSATPGDRIVLKAKKDYYGAKPAYDDVTLRIIPEAAARMAAVEAKEVDLAFDIPVADVARLNKENGLAAGWIDSSRMMVLKINTLKAPLDKQAEVRQALNYAVDKKAIADAIYAGASTVSACQLVSPQYFGFNPDLKAYPYDPEKAKQLLKAAGVSGKLDVELEVPLGRYLAASDLAQIIGQQLSEVGINAKIHEMEFGAWAKKYAGGDLGNMALTGQAWPTLDADGLLSLYDSSNPTSYFKNADFDAALAKARSTTDVNARLEQYKIATKIMCEQAPDLFLFSQPTTYTHSKGVTWQARGDEWVRASDVTPAK